jgi:hypothetical protein
MSRKSYDELPWWCQLLWLWFGPPWYEQVDDLDAYLAVFRLGLTMRARLAEELAGDDQPGEGYLAKAGRLIAARLQTEEIINHGNGPLTPSREDDEDEDGELIPDVERPVVVDRDHPSWAEVNAEQQERIHGSATPHTYRIRLRPGWQCCGTGEDWRQLVGALLSRWLLPWGTAVRRRAGRHARFSFHALFAPRCSMPWTFKPVARTRPPCRRCVAAGSTSPIAY